MIITCVLNNKGGVGKSTTVINLAAYLALHHKQKVLIIDLDAQGNTSQSFGCLKNGFEEGTHSILTKPIAPSKVIYKTEIENLDIIPADIRLTKTRPIIEATRYREGLLSRFLEKVTDYDHIIMDTNPDINVILDNGVTACNFIIVPIEIASWALEGFGNLFEMIDQLKEDSEINGNVGVLYTRFNASKTRMHGWMNDQMQNYTSLIFKTRINQDEELNVANRERKSIFEWNPKSRGAGDYKNFGDEFVQMMAQKPKPKRTITYEKADAHIRK